jgi:CheY-like chemotaxis protein
MDFERQYDVLVVEDDDIFADLVAILLHHMGYKPIVTHNGSEALSVLSNNPNLPSLIISDVMMPYMDGLELTETVKRHPYWQTIPIILLSAGESQQVGSLADYFLSKPFKADNLEKIIHNLIHPQQLSGSLPLQARQDKILTH